jgi:hypothetical protein
MTKKASIKKQLSLEEREEIISVLKRRFLKNMHRHQGVDWIAVEKRLEGAPVKLWSLNEMERSGGEPDVVILGKKTNDYTFFDCSQESPKGRRSVCYDREALDARKENKPKSSAMEMAEAMGVDILTEDEYRGLQNLEEFDTKTSSWIITPDAIRKLGGALFCDRRYDHVFVYHNGAESYYAARGFRSVLRI